MSAKSLTNEAERVGRELGLRIRESRPADVAGFLARVFEVATDVVAGKPKADDDKEVIRRRLLARGVLARRRLEEAEGGAITTEEVAANLGVTRQAVDARRQRGQLVAWRTNDKKWRFPTWQFGSNGLPLKGVAECIGATRLDNEWSAMIFFLSAAESLGGSRPLDLLRQGETEQATDYAKRYHRHGA
jgi:hypothetical protein